MIEDERCFSGGEMCIGGGERTGSLCMSYEMRCPGYGKCPYFKSMRQYREERMRVCRRLATLPEKQQRQIARKYYYGQMPWRDVE